MKSVYVAGHTGLVGSALARRFSVRAGLRLVTAGRAELDLLDAQAVERFLGAEKPEAVIIAAGRVGGIAANASKPAEFIYENLRIETNLIHGSWKTGVKRLLNFGSACMYPKECPQPMKPVHLMTGKMEETSEAYAAAKWAGMMLCSAYSRQYGLSYVTAIPSTVYGPGDNFDPKEGHVLSSLIRKFHEATGRGDREVVLWGSGEPRREFIYSDDLAEACEKVLDEYQGGDPINVGVGQSISIRELAGTVAEITGFRGTVSWDRSRPDGPLEKLLESGPIRAMGWKPQTALRDGLERTFQWYLRNDAAHLPLQATEKGRG